jgi:hypothetical protein
VDTDGVGTFTVNTNSGVAAVTAGTITAGHTATGTSSSSAVLDLGPIPTSTITSDKRYVISGDTATLTLTFSSPVMTDDYVLSFVSPNESLVPAIADMPLSKGATGAVIQVPTLPVGPSTATVRLAINALGNPLAAYSFKIGTVGVKSITFDENSLFEGDSTTAHVVLTFPAQGETIVAVTSSSSSRADSFNVTIADGETTGTATVNTNNAGLAASAVVNMTAKVNGYAKKAPLTLNPLVVSLTPSSDNVMSGESVTFTVTLAKTFETDQTFTFTGGGFAGFGLTYTVPANSLTGTATCKSVKVLDAPKTFTVKANIMGYERKCRVTVNPLP